MRVGAASAALLAGAARANPNQFEAVVPGGATSCFHGGEFSFMHRKGTVNKLVIEFEGGGACWNSLTCGVGSCTQTVNKANKVSMLNGKNSGIHDGSNAKNVFAEWYHVFVPYCTCDCHTGTVDQKYGAKTVYHRGHINFESVMNWTRANFPATPAAVAITGCSAGSMGAALNWPFVADAYPSAKHYVFGDSEVGLSAEAQYNDGYKNWGESLDTRIAGLAPSKVSTYTANSSCYITTTESAAFPKAVVGMYTSNADAVQSSFYVMGGGKAWTAGMRSLVKCMNAGANPIHTFIASGNAHCRSQDDGYYSVVTDGQNLAEWVADIVTDARSLRNVDCADSGECSADAADAPPLSLAGYGSRVPYQQ